MADASPEATVVPPPTENANALRLVAERLADWLDLNLSPGGIHRDGIRLLRRYAAEIPGSISPLTTLASLLGLAPIEVDLIALSGLADEHEAIAGLFRMVHPRGEPAPTLGLAAQLFCESFEERQLLRDLSEVGPAARHGVLRLRGEGPTFERSLALADALWSPLRQGDAWPQGIARITLSDLGLGYGAFLQQPAARAARALLEKGERCTILVVAPDASSARERAAALVRASNFPFFCFDWEASRAALPDAERLIALHSLARDAVPILRVAADDASPAPERPWFDAYPSTVIFALAAGAIVPRSNRPLLTVSAESATPELRRATWASALPLLAKHAGTLAARYPVDASLAHSVALDVQLRAKATNRAASVEDVADSIRTRMSNALPPGIALYRPTAGWNALVLAPHAKAQIQEASDRLLHQHRVLHEWGFLSGRAGARGVRVLLAGPPGTGKTLSAEVIAHSLGFDLLVVDVSRIVSKWIGETEKNLAAVFDMAERTPAVLLFDEADALFGKRTEVTDAHDRYANLETAYLLSRIERFDGLLALSTNYRKNIDAAFMRRMEFIVDFEEPGANERLRLWQCHVPPNAPLAPEVDLSELSELYPLVGGHIRNAAVGAAFLAAAEGCPIARRHLFRAVQREYEKSGRAFPGAPPHERTQGKAS